MNTMDGSVSRPTEADLAEKTKRRLEQRRIPRENWPFYTEAPETWDFNDIAPSGIQRGTDVIMLSSNTTTPSWVRKDSVDHFIKIRGKLTEIKLAKEEIDRFVKEEVLEDNQLVAAHK